MRVLVVDDSPTCQRVITRSLAHLEFTFVEASNGEEALRILTEKPLRVDAVLMDLRMPVMDGLTAIRKCRIELGLTSLPIIALTAEVGSSIKAEAMKAGATWFLNKPARSQELISILRALSFGEV
jgi:CheY-like chemotaxis protein